MKTRSELNLALYR